MRILHIANITSNKTAGVNVAVSQHVLAQGKDAITYFYNINGEPILELKESQIYPETTDDLTTFLKKSNIDIVVFHEAYRPKYLLISKLLRKFKIPYVIIPHGELSKGSQKHKWLKKKIANILLFNRFINKAKALQCLSAQEVNNTAFKVEKFVASNGIVLPSKVKNSFNKGDIVFVGRMDIKIKGIDIMLEAVSHCVDLLRKENIKIKLYGPSSGSADAIEAIISKYKISDVVQLCPPVVGDEKESVLLNSRFFIQTSRTEGMPMGILEALAYGVPCLITKGTALGDIVEKYNAGWVADTNVASVSKNLTLAICSKELDDKSRNALKLIKENYCWGITIKPALCKYNEIIGEK